MTDIKRLDYKKFPNLAALQGGNYDVNQPALRLELNQLSADYNAKTVLVSGYEQAIGLLTTLVPDLRMDGEHPLEMAGRIVARFQDLEAKLEIRRAECAMVDSTSTT